MEYPYVEDGLVYFNEETIVVDEPIGMRWHPVNRDYYINLGYQYTNWKDLFHIDVQHLPKGSSTRINAICPRCKYQRSLIFSSLTRFGHTKCQSCAQLIDETGNVHGRWLVHKQGESKNGETMWLCECECGTFRDVKANSLRRGESTSCGCWQKEIMRGYMTGENNHMWGRSGVNSPAYNPNLTQADRDSVRGHELVKWKNKVKIRDNNRCQSCGQYGVDITAHHLNGYKDFPEQRTDLHNGVTLCIPCHKQFHSWMGNNRVKCTRGDFIEFCYAFYPNALFL